jgi:hypothetical protein
LVLTRFDIFGSKIYLSRIRSPGDFMRKGMMQRFGEEKGNAIHFIFDGEQLSAYPGDTIASALYALGRRSWRRSRAGDERGLLCGIGVCFDCLLAVDGIVNLRACQTLLTEGMVVETNLVT